MNDLVVIRPQKIASMRESMEELGRAGGLMRDALTESNDEAHQKFFAPVLERLDLIVANEREGLTQFIADDLDGLRSAIRRIRLPDIDPELEMPTKALRALRSERGNLIESVDTALEAAAALGLHSSNSAGGQLIVASRDVTEHLIRLDERLRTVQQTVGDLQDAAVMADRETNRSINFSLVNFHVQTMKVELSAARFETKIGSDNEIATGADLNVLIRSIENIRDIAGDLKTSTVVMRERMPARVAAAAEVVVKAANRAYSGLKTVVSAIRRRVASKKPARPRIFYDEVVESAKATDEVSADPPADFDLAEVHAMILRGETPKASWRPFIAELDFDGVEEFADLASVAGLSALRVLSFDDSRVGNLAPISDFGELTFLSLADSQVTDLFSVSGLGALRWLNVEGTSVSDLSPVSSLTALIGLYLSRTQVSDLSPVSSLMSLEWLYLDDTQVSDLSPVSGLSVLTGLSLDNTQVSDLSPVSSLNSLSELSFDNTKVSDLSPIAGLIALKELSLSNTQVQDLGPLSSLTNLTHLSLDGTGVSVLLPSERDGVPLEFSQEIDLRPLSNLKNLKELSLNNMSGVVDLSVLAVLTNLDVLHIDSTLVEKISALDRLPYLTIIGGPAPRSGEPRVSG
jgi:Leucine-rich repeat (LRR) protein